MVSRSDYESAYYALKENVSPVLRKKIEDKKIFHIVKEDGNGKEKHAIDRNDDSP